MASTSSPSPPPENIPNWVDLPPEVTATILNLLGPIEILNTARKVCVTWHKICNDPSMWKSIEMFKHSYMEYRQDIEMMCRHAVDLSCGLLDHITLTFGKKELLLYVADRSPRLRSLRVVSCFKFTEDNVDGEVAKKLPNLEELHMFFNGMATSDLEKRIDVLESFGRCCPQLKSLTYDNYSSLFTYLENVSDKEAVAIAQTMPGLRHLSLLGNQMTNKGLHAILKGCPHLESLDLRRCLNVDLSGDAGSICAKRIKNFKRPNDSTDGYKFYAEITNDYGDSLYEVYILSDDDDDYEFSDGGGSMSDE